MTADYTQVDTEVLGRMMQAAKQSQNISAEPLAALQEAVEERKRQLEEKLSQAERSTEEENRIDTEEERREYLKKERERACLKIYDELITLDPDNYEYYKRAASQSYFLDDYRSAAAYYTSALQVVDDDPKKIWELYKERARIFSRLNDFRKTLEDGKMALRFRYLVPRDAIDINRELHYFAALDYISQGLEGMGNHELAEQIDAISKYAYFGDEGLNDALIEELFLLLNIPVPTKSGTAAGQSPTPRVDALKQSIFDPIEVRKRPLRLQFFNEYEMHSGWSPKDFSLLLQITKDLIALEPDNYRYHAAAGEICDILKDYVSAISYYTAALPLVDSYSRDVWWVLQVRDEHIFRLYARRADAFVRLKNYREALADGERALRAKPDHLAAHYLAGMMVFSYRNMGNPVREELVNDFEKILGVTLADAEHKYKESLDNQLERIYFVEFSMVGTEKGMREKTLRGYFLTSGPPAQEIKAQDLKAAEMLKSLERLFTLMRTA